MSITSTLDSLLDKLVKSPETKLATDPDVVDFVAATMAASFGAPKEDFVIKAKEALVAYAAIKLVERGILK